MIKILNIKKFRTKSVQSHINRLGEPLVETLFVDDADATTPNPLYLYVRQLFHNGYTEGTFDNDTYISNDTVAVFTEYPNLATSNIDTEISMRYATGVSTYAYNFKANFNKAFKDRRRRTIWYICIFKNGSFGFKTKSESAYSTYQSPFRVVIPQKPIKLTANEATDIVNDLNIVPMPDYAIGE